MKYNKELTLSIAPYKVIKIGITDAESFDACDKELWKELNRHPDIKILNQEEIKKVLGVDKSG
jgi:hypothetical protein